jgi:hypothetical protein
MTRTPTLAEISAVELRLLQSKRNLRQSLDRARSALGTAMTRSSTLTLVAVASGLSAFWFARRLRPTVNAFGEGGGPATQKSRRGLLRTFIARYGTQVVSLLLQYGTAKWKEQGSRVDSSMPRTSATDATAAAERDGPRAGRPRVG